MSDIAMEAARLLDMLPESDKIFALEFIKKLVLVWDPDFTKITDDEAELINKAESSGFIADNDIDWADLRVTAEQLRAELQAGYEDMKAGNVQNAADAFAAFRDAHKPVKPR